MKEYQVPILIKATQSVFANTWDEAVKNARCANYIVDFKTIDEQHKAKMYTNQEIPFIYWLEKYRPLKNPKTFFRTTARELDHFITKEFYHYIYNNDNITLTWLKTMPSEVVWTLVNVNYCIDYIDCDKEFRILSGFYNPDTDFNTDSAVEGYFLTEKGVNPDEAYQIIINGDRTSH